MDCTLRKHIVGDLEGVGKCVLLGRGGALSRSLGVDDQESTFHASSAMPLVCCILRPPQAEGLVTTASVRISFPWRSRHDGRAAGAGPPPIPAVMKNIGVLQGLGDMVAGSSLGVLRPPRDRNRALAVVSFSPI
jgi:hypothetical protein